MGDARWDERLTPVMDKAVVYLANSDMESLLDKLLALRLITRNQYYELLGKLSLRSKSKESVARDVFMILSRRAAPSYGHFVDVLDEVDGADDLQRCLLGTLPPTPNYVSMGTSRPTEMDEEIGVSSHDVVGSEATRNEREDEDFAAPELLNSVDSTETASSNSIPVLVAELTKKGVLYLDYDHLRKATNDFKHLSVEEGGTFVRSDIYYDAFNAELDVGGQRKKVCIKKLKLPFEDGLSEGLRQQQVLERIKTYLELLPPSHENIVELLGVSTDGKDVCLVHEDMCGGVLAEAILGASEPILLRTLLVVCFVFNLRCHDKIMLFI
eukprot:m.279354 g.279354  ORF g.279354 m.279354 type:complete len:326 (+) comp40622_c2_seq76:386-1363(+)